MSLLPECIWQRSVIRFLITAQRSFMHVDGYKIMHRHVIFTLVSLSPSLHSVYNIRNCLRAQEKGILQCSSAAYKGDRSCSRKMLQLQQTYLYFAFTLHSHLATLFVCLFVFRPWPPHPCHVSPAAFPSLRAVNHWTYSHHNIPGHLRFQVWGLLYLPRQPLIGQDGKRKWKKSWRDVSCSRVTARGL